jgi:Domain of unknown function (DUF5666)
MTAPGEASDDPDDDLFAGWEPRRRVPRLTVVLATCLLVVAGFAVGAVVARRSASTTTATAATAAAARFAGAGGAAGRSGVGGFGGGGSGAVSASGTPVVVGTVASVAANRITVTNFAGQTVVVRVPARTPVTTPGLGGLRKGQTVSVEGTRASDGSVTATAVVSRS